MNNWVLIIMNICTWIALLVFYLLMKNYLPKYFQEKGKNLATKEDIREITDKVESVKTDYARQLELFKHEMALLEKRRELSAQVVDLINRYKELPPEDGKASDAQLRSFEQDYYKLIPWIPTDILKALNLLFSKSKPCVAKPDVKDVIISVRKVILNDECGDFKGGDIINFVGFGKQMNRI
ncbi:MAG: hypothetical protein WAW31_15735 [Smithella sp.]|jgi:hypothetical protein